MRKTTLLLLLSVLSISVAMWGSATAEETAESGKVFGFPLTSESGAALKSLSEGVNQYEYLRVTVSLGHLRDAVKADPNFAIAHLTLARTTTDPAERLREFKRAEQLTSRASEDEQLMIRWFTRAEQSRLIDAITAMNELLARYPKNKRLQFAAAVFYNAQGAHDRAREACQRALEIDPNYGPALNELGYEYAFVRQVDKAIPLMERYIALLPNEPNPQDSYAEILRMSGRFDAAIMHYRKALALDAHFDSSQVGIADTLQLMGRFDEARAEYEKAVAMVPDEDTKLQYLERSAQTYVRAKDYAGADRAYSALSARAHKALKSEEEAQILRTMAMYQQNDEKAFALLDQATAALYTGNISAAAKTTALSFILRDRAVRGARVNRPEIATKSISELQALYDRTTRADVLEALNISRGAFFLSQNKKSEASPLLQDAQDDAVGLFLLQSALPSEQAAAAREKLAAIHELTIEQAITR
ncbi:MAG TPA: tetratricopeptide repeat protein [Candidatus Acidoferrales bacterium]|nr:tetratricopeptide repeat protein [Candidatus Acidoferrales bacterium]